MTIRNKTSGRKLAKTAGVSPAIVSRKRKQGKSDEQIAAEAAARRPSKKAAESYSESLARKERALAALRELELAKAKGEVVSTQLVADEWASLCGNIKNAILAVPDRIALSCEGQPARAIREKMMVELRSALAVLSEDIKKSAEA